MPSADSQVTVARSTAGRWVLTSSMKSVEIVEALAGLRFLNYTERRSSNWTFASAILFSTQSPHDAAKLRRMVALALTDDKLAVVMERRHRSIGGQALGLSPTARRPTPTTRLSSPPPTSMTPCASRCAG
jgi:hypothetical protein